MTWPSTVIEVFADVACPFTHAGLRRFVDRRRELRREDVRLHVRAWPLELVNGEPLDPHFVAEEVEDIRRQMPGVPFAGFTEATFPATSLPALALAGAAYRRDLALGERVSLELRDMLFEQGLDVADPTVLARLGEEHGLHVESVDEKQVVDDHAEGVERGVVGSPHFFTPSGSFFCPTLDVRREDSGHLHVAEGRELRRFLAACFGD